jgi:hypothetical protein
VGYISASGSDRSWCQNALLNGGAFTRRVCAAVACLSCLYLLLSGCSPLKGYSNESLFPEDIHTVCVHMFDNRSFRRNMEYDLTDALAKRIEAQTPYKIVSDQDRADTLITGQIVSISDSALTMDRELGQALEKELNVTAVVNWKNLKTGDLLIDNQTVMASADYSQFLNQGVGYAKNLSANKLAEQIVGLMEEKW